MDRTEALEKLLHSYEQYYDIHRENVEEPFSAMAEFHDHTEQYFLVRSAHLSSIDSNEYVYFALVEELDGEKAAGLTEAAWQAGTALVKPDESHRSSDISLFILADTVTEEARRHISHVKHYQSYRHGLQGWSQFRAIAVELSTGRAVYNRLGDSLKKLAASLIVQRENT